MKKILLAATVIVMMFLALNVFAGQATVTLTWQAPTTNADGTELKDLAGYKIYYGTVSGKYDNSEDAGNVTEYKLALPKDGTYYFAVTAYDTTGNESKYSSEISRTLPVEAVDTPAEPNGVASKDIAIKIVKADGTAVTIIIP